MKTLMFVAALSVLSATGALGQGVAYDPYATTPPLPHSPDVGVFDQGQSVTQHYINRVEIIVAPARRPPSNPFAKRRAAASTVPAQTRSPNKVRADQPLLWRKESKWQRQRD